MGTKRSGAVGALALACLVAASCATPAPGPQHQGSPDDLALEVTVFRPHAGSVGLRRYRCERYVLLADGSLHWERRAGSSAAWFPAYRRTLASDQVAAIWRLIDAHGLGMEGSAPPASAALLKPDPAGATGHGIVTAGGRRWAHAGSLEGEGANGGLALLVSRLDTLAWVSR